MAAFQNNLRIHWQGKAVPYGAIPPREDGSTNHGFKNLKGQGHPVSSIPELQQDAALKSLVGGLCERECGLFTVGCLSADVREARGFRVTGYREIALNSKAAIQDASRSFPIFFHFDRFLHGNDFSERVHFQWELRPAALLDANLSGFTCAITINTEFHSSRESARECWVVTLKALEYYLSSIHSFGPDGLY
jgi:hypothetical protein